MPAALIFAVVNITSTPRRTLTAGRLMLIWVLHLIERKNLNRLVIATLDGTCMRAVTLYDKLQREDPGILRKEKIRGFRSFAKVINTFHDVEQTGNKTKFYVLRKDQILK